MPPSVQKPTLAYPGGTLRYQADLSMRHGVWIGLVLTVILNYSPQSSRPHSGTKLRHIVTAVKRTLCYEDWYSGPGFLQKTILKILERLPCFITQPLPTGLDEGEQLWRSDRTQNNATPDKLSNEREVLARLARNRWYWESMSRNPMSLRRVLKELCEDPGTTSGPTTLPSNRLKANRSAGDSSRAKQNFGKHTRRSSAPAAAGSFQRVSRQPLVAVDNIVPGSSRSLALSLEPIDLPSSPRAPVQQWLKSLAHVSSSLDHRAHSPREADRGGDTQPQTAASPTALTSSGIGLRGSAQEEARTIAPHFATTPVPSPTLLSNLPLPSVAEDNADTAQPQTPLFLPSSSPDRVTRKAGKRRQDDDEDYVLSDSPSSDRSEWSSTLDSESDIAVQEHAASLLLSLTRSGSEFGPPIMLGAGNRNPPPRDPPTEVNKFVRAVQKPTASSSKRKMEDSIVERHVNPRLLKRRVAITKTLATDIDRSNTVHATGSPATSSSKRKPGEEHRSNYHKVLARLTETSASAIVRSGNRAPQAKTTSSAHHYAPADDDAVILDTLINILSDSDNPKRVMEERLIWDAFRHEMPHIPRKVYYKVLSHEHLFFCEKQSSSAPDRSSELVPYYGCVRQHSGY
ncbi:hypothetical protein BD410DRAFT_787069 [Rickenella mellea]|uniref:Uncharacterized protein n=1 Tax=Rickenella mellea TaxID=50990 RepID=A0A4Y7QAE4_9AGAM|nr:hypothetical protein BD410DRAFT_787069 [Rickenella mellea]